MLRTLISVIELEFNRPKLIYIIIYSNPNSTIYSSIFLIFLIKHSFVHRKLKNVSFENIILFVIFLRIVLFFSIDSWVFYYLYDIIIIIHS